MDQATIRNTAQRLVKLRCEIIEIHPFFGRLLLRMPFGFAECETAFTDMKKIVFDPEFASRLDDRQLSFIILHELMHCVLKHCLRSDGKLHRLYNIACDIVVNSMVLEAMNLKEIEIDGEKAMHLTPDNVEGREHSAEEIYGMLLKRAKSSLGNLYEKSGVDNHEMWDKISGEALVEDLWDSYMRKAVNDIGGTSGIPDSVERHISKIYHAPKISWKQILHDYLQNDNYDYLFTKPDTRFSGEFVMPSFREDEENSKIEKVFFFIDTSGSVSADIISESFEEIKDAISQIGRMSGMVLFFDSQIADPIPFESVEDIDKMKPVGGGGTSFRRIFEYINKLDEENLPSVVIIMTDGYATFPDEKMAINIPVIWLIIDSDIDAPWGECLHIYSQKQ